MTFQKELAEKIGNAILYLESMGVTDGDIVDGLRETKDALESTIAMYVYVPLDLVSVADDLGIRFDETDGEKFLSDMHAGKTKDFQDMGYEVIRQSLEESIADWKH